MPHVKDTLCVAFQYHREQFVERLSNWSIQAVNNSPRMAIMHRYPDLCIPETGICKAQRDGVKYCTQVVNFLSTTPESQNDWRVQPARPPSPMSRTFLSFVFSHVIKEIARFSDQHPAVAGAHAARPSMTCMFIFNNIFSSKGFSMYFVIMSAGFSAPNILHSSMAPDLTLSCAHTSKCRTLPKHRRRQMPRAAFASE